MESVHFYAWVAIPPGSEIDDAVAAAMEPYRVNEDQQESDAEDDADVWDFWTIGGRYTGALDGFDPLQDPENQETCPRCSGSGIGAAPGEECPRCRASGRVATSPQRWRRHPGDVQSLHRVVHLDLPATLVTPAGIHQAFTVDGASWTDERGGMRAALDALDPASLIVVVDYHR